ncbi:MAG: ankyrin repeat domain-containing protein, partial [Zoogloeaceae bacterium]|nr:ankyrin repeat domain-containing protein [Zoogloeaceae bacterium]
MAKKRKTLPKNFGELVEAGDIPALKAVFDSCELDANDGYGKKPALSFYGIPAELLRWLVEQGADINARDRYQKTPLHSQVGMHCEQLELLLELGADIEARDYDEETPLHTAAMRFQRHAVRSLLAHGANIHAANKSGQTPLALALVYCRNCDISAAAEIAALLLDAGAQVTPEMTEQVQRIGKEFEFHRENFNKDSLAEADAGLARLYALFQVAPIAKRRVHDGVSRITVTAARWEDQH